MTDSTEEIIGSLEEETRRALESGSLQALARSLAGQRPADIADVIDRLDRHERVAIFRALTSDVAAEVLDEASFDATRDLIEELPGTAVGALLDRLPMDDVAEILTEDVPERREELLAVMSPADAREVRDLLRYPENSAGRIMTEQFVRVAPGMTAAETIEGLRRLSPDVETLTDFYSLDERGRLDGVVSLRDVVTAQPETRIAEMLTRDVVTVTPETDQEEVARLVSRYDFLAIPVVDERGVMLGLITVDDVIDVLVAESTEDVLRFAGIESGPAINQPYFSIPILRVVRKRVGWLLLLFVAETLTGSVLRTFEHELASVVALSFFIPLLIGTGGNTGSQTVSTLIRGLALKEIALRDTFRVLRRELVGGLVLGLLLGAVAFGRAELWGSPRDLALVVGVSVLAICTWANTIGALIPLVAHRFRIDPAVVSAPLITTLVDATGLAIYLLIAKSVLGL